MLLLHPATDNPDSDPPLLYFWLLISASLSLLPHSQPAFLISSVIYLLVEPNPIYPCRLAVKVSISFLSSLSPDPLLSASFSFPFPLLPHFSFISALVVSAISHINSHLFSVPYAPTHLVLVSAYSENQNRGRKHLSSYRRKYTIYKLQWWPQITAVTLESL